jgi:hypothetical protein
MIAICIPGLLVDTASIVGTTIGGSHGQRPHQRFGETGQGQSEGSIVGDSKLESEGKGDQVKGKVQNAVGGIKDTLRGK